MKHIIFTVGFFLVLITAKAQDFRNANWGDSPEEVFKKETLALVNKTTNNKIMHLNFVQFTESDVYLTYSYMFYNNQLIGVKTKTAYLTKDNSRYNVEQLYNQTYRSYQEKYQNLNEEKENNVSKFNIVLKDKKIYVEMKGEANEYFLVESIMKSKKG